jgi:putative ABC transport system permease protein
MLWLLVHTGRRSLRRLALTAIGVAFPVASLAATLLFIDHAVHSMTPVALAPVQVEMRALATSLDIDVAAANRRLAATRDVARVERFAQAEVFVSAPGGQRVAARLFAVDPEYLQRHRWVGAAEGELARGALLTKALRDAPAFASATTMSVTPPGESTEDEPLPSIALPVGGQIDLRDARTWFEIPVGDMQGDVASIPNALVVDYGVFERTLLPALRDAAKRAGTDVLDEGATSLPYISLESHVTVDHGRYPSDPARAAKWSATLQRVLARQTPGAFVVADNAADLLGNATVDATNAKILFLLLGIPGALVAGGAGLAAVSALTASHRREDALLELRGATSGQLARLAVGNAAIAGVAGAALGLFAGFAGVGAVVGRAVWRDIPPGRIAVTAGVAIAAGIAVTLVRVMPLVRAGRRPDIAARRRLLEAGWTPRWRRARLDLTALGVGTAILAINLLAGGLRQTPIEGQTLSLAFYVLLAPMAIWLGATLLVIRAVSAALRRGTRPGTARPLTTWVGAGLRWMGRRPARTATALVLGALAVAFGTNVVTFAATYEQAKATDLRAAFGADLRLTPVDPNAALPGLGPDVVSTSPIRTVPARSGGDRETVQAIDPATYRQTASITPRIVAGRGLDALIADPTGVLVHFDSADRLGVAVDDQISLTLFPDEPRLTRNLSLRVLGVYRSFPPDAPLAEFVVTTAAFPAAALPPPDYHLVRVAAGTAPELVAADLRRRAAGFTVTMMADQVIQERHTLTALDLRRLGRLEAVVAAAVAAVGVAVLGAYLVLERRRESALLRTIGATTRQILTAPAIDATVAVIGSLAIGVPVGIGVSMLSIRVLGLFFTLPPPLVVLPGSQLLQLAALMVATSAVAMAFALRAVARQTAAQVLREP